MRIRMPRRDARSGFTLIELLAVIGIMCLLMVISIPVVSTVWKYSKNTSTWSEMSALANSIANYKLDQGALPGPLPETAMYGYNFSPVPVNVVSAGFLVSPPTAANFQVTSSENLVLGLLGGLQLDKGGKGVCYQDATQIGHPQILNAQTPLQKDVYYPMNKGDLSDDGFGNPMSWTAGNTQMGFTPTQFSIPEFLDRFGNPRPIIYLRANVDAPFVSDSVQTAAATGDNRSQYYSTELLPYGFVFPTPVDPSNNNTSLYPTAQSFFQNPTMNNQYIARGQNAYLLISAGLDGQYGTKDDLVWPKN